MLKNKKSTTLKNSKYVNHKLSEKRIKITSKIDVTPDLIQKTLQKAFDQIFKTKFINCSTYNKGKDVFTIVVDATKTGGTKTEYSAKFAVCNIGYTIEPTDKSFDSFAGKTKDELATDSRSFVKDVYKAANVVSLEKEAAKNKAKKEARIKLLRNKRLREALLVSPTGQSSATLANKKVLVGNSKIDEDSETYDPVAAAEHEFFSKFSKINDEYNVRIGKQIAQKFGIYFDSETQSFHTPHTEDAYNFGWRDEDPEVNKAYEDTTSLTDYQKNVIVDMVQADFEVGLPQNDAEELKGLLLEDGDFDDSNVDEAVNYYFELTNLGPEGFLEEFPDLDWSDDYIAEYGNSDDYEDEDEDEENLEEASQVAGNEYCIQVKINGAKDWRTISVTENTKAGEPLIFRSEKEAKKSNVYKRYKELADEIRIVNNTDRD